MTNRACPHDNIAHCPLYVASHAANGLGCDDGRLFEGECAVARGMDYDAQLAKLIRADLEIVAECEWRARKQAASLQRLRNMKTNGVH
jgi:hypothetical protein